MLKSFFLGIYEFRRSFTWVDPDRSEDDWYTAKDEAYDLGREWAHRLTFRRFER